jgi:hypothetical protein
VAEIQAMIQDVWLADWLALTQVYVNIHLGSFHNVQWGGYLPARPKEPLSLPVVRMRTWLSRRQTTTVLVLGTFKTATRAITRSAFPLESSLQVHCLRLLYSFSSTTSTLRT